ncbi:triose-phosphate isomerase [Candidatus Methanoprimaticola sp. MG2]|uniref:triose-phosphate isomerase n=1 Tax=Candidatus Methanoprimaticola sp. MG2 TaxID=3228838 RepID=UPI0039C7385F
MKAPVVVINFKAYQEAEGDRAFRLAKACQKVSSESGVPMAVCPPHLWLGAIARILEMPVYAQSVDPLPPGPGTGFVTPSMLHSTDVAGTLVNHSEHRIPKDDIGKIVEMCSALKLHTCICAETAEEASDLAGFHPNAVAVEPPALIGGNVSVTSADPGIVSGTVDAVKAVDPKVLVYCGAGVKTGDDVKASMDLGANGVLLASGVVKAKDPEQVLRDLISKI